MYSHILQSCNYLQYKYYKINYKSIIVQLQNVNELEINEYLSIV